MVRFFHSGSSDYKEIFLFFSLFLGFTTPLSSESEWGYSNDMKLQIFATKGNNTYSEYLIHSDDFRVDIH